MNRKLLSGIAAVLLCAPALLAGEDAPAPMIINIADRNAVSLDGQWKYLVDPYGIGYHNYRLTPFPDAESFFADKSFDDDRTKLVEYGFNRGGEMTVPGDWNTQYEKLYYYEGKVWYRTRFNASPKPDKRYFIYFGAVNHTAVVGVNGRKVARHEGGFTPFNIEVTDKLKDGENSLVVMVDNTRQKDGIPTNNCDWWNYGGITRSVKLVEVPRTFIRDYAVLMDKEIIGKTRRNRPDSHRIYGYVNLDGDAAGKAVNISIPELKLSLDVVADASGHAAFEAVAAPKLWSPDSPVLYDVRISSEEDSTSDRVGFRTIETSGDRILLNGKEIFLRGISIHEESVAPVGRITRPEQDRELLEYAKDLGCNFVRLAHYPHNEEMVRLCEEMGLLAWSEIPVYWTVSWTNEATFANARKQLEEMVTRDINRACIIIWSVANETPISPERTRFLSALIDRTREMDGTRLVSAAMEKTTIARNHYTVDDPLLEYTDLISFNQYIGWYGGTSSEDCDATVWEFPVKKPVFISEFGAGALYGNHGPRTERFTEEYMADCYERNIRMMVERMPGFSGTSPWILKDFRSPRRALNGIQDDYNRKGVISESGQKKMAYYVLQDWYKKLKEGK